jgi:hypothetical protein
VVTKTLAAAVVLLALARLFMRRDSEIARRFRLFVDVCLVLMFVVYGIRLAQMWL